MKIRRRAAILAYACAGTVVILLGLIAPATASAVDYTRATFECRGDRGSGQTDAAGRFYLACRYRGGVVRPHVQVYNATGALLAQHDVDFADGTSNQLSDVAPSPDGSFLYVMRHTTKTSHRLVRQADGSYVIDRVWKPALFGYQGANWAPLGEFITTDALGFIYIASGTWSNSPMTIVKYTPAGAVVTRFGDAAPSWAGGSLHWLLTGVSVTPDGSSVYATEVGNNRVQRFDRQLDGSYRWGLLFGNSQADDNPLTQYDEARGGACFEPGKFAAPYDVAVDGAGKVYVINTSCFLGTQEFEVQIFSRDGAWLQSLRPKSQYYDKVHAIAVDAAGNIYLAQAGIILRASTPPVVVPPPLPPPPPPADTTAPTLRAVTLPAQVTGAQVAVTIDAIDDVAATQLRIANETQQVANAAWQPYAATVAHTLSAGDGAKTVSVQVRDAAGNLSAVVAATTTLTTPVIPPPPAVNTAPVLRAVTLPNPATAQTITLVIDAVDDQAVTTVRMADESGTWQAWQPYAPTMQFTLSAGGAGLLKGVFVQVRDMQGLTSATLYRTTLFQPVVAPPPPPPDPDPDPEPDPDPVPVPQPNTRPTLRNVILPNPTATQLVLVTIDAIDNAAVTTMRLANEDGNWGAWRPFTPTVQWLLTPGKRKKGVFVQVRDAQGLESAVIYKTTMCTPCTPPPA